MALSAPAMPMFAMMMPLAVFLPAYYADSLGLGMAAVGSIFALGRTFDVVTDPFAGVLMDRLQTVVQRKTWLAIGALPIASCGKSVFCHRPSFDNLGVWMVVVPISRLDADECRSLQLGG